MLAVLLCAGFGTRMGEETTPKPLLEVGGTSFLDVLAADLAEAESLDAVHVVTNHRYAQAFRAWADVRRPEYEEKGTTVTVHDDGVEHPDEALGAVGDLRFVLDRIDVPSDGVVVAGVDSLYRFPIAPLVDAVDGNRSRLLALYEPDEDARRHSSVLHLNGKRVEAVTDAGAAPDADADPFVSPLVHFLTDRDVQAVGPYLDARHDADDFGPFVNTLAQTRRVDAIRMPETAGLRFHCNTAEQLDEARQALETESRLLLDAETLRRRFGDDR